MTRAFTLLEMIFVLLIIGILSALGFAQYQRMIERARRAGGRGLYTILKWKWYN